MQLLKKDKTLRSETISYPNIHINSTKFTYDTQNCEIRIQHIR